MSLTWKPAKNNALANSRSLLLPFSRITAALGLFSIFSILGIFPEKLIGNLKSNGCFL